jgi:hypothetical protein
MQCFTASQAAQLVIFCQQLGAEKNHSGRIGRRFKSCHPDQSGVSPLFRSILTLDLDRSTGLVRRSNDPTVLLFIDTRSALPRPISKGSDLIASYRDRVCPPGWAIILLRFDAARNRKRTHYPGCTASRARNASFSDSSFASCSRSGRTASTISGSVKRRVMCWGQFQSNASRASRKIRSTLAL